MFSLMLARSLSLYVSTEITGSEKNIRIAVINVNVDNLEEI
jgi:hypothetical protein